ncbi:MAG: type II 3-dehydroquinate dehydratase [Proteobacteria bacterium]|nr:MAG: type II 3-dehydroquinate dehydratase [Pseudomonadota bacterium]
MKPISKLSVIVAHGVNLDLLGRREPGIYGKHTLADIEAKLRQISPIFASAFSLPTVELTFFQSNHEGVFLDELSKPWDAAVINAGAWTHSSLALADRLVALSLPFVEVHISNLSAREEFRQKSFAARHAIGVCYGFGIDSYTAALSGLYAVLAERLKSSIAP